MELFTDAVIAFPRAQVFVAYRDRLAETTQHLPNIRAIDVKSREERDGEVRLVNEWTGGGDIPKVARAFLSPDMLKWTDHATWKEATFEVAWRTDVHAFPERRARARAPTASSTPTVAERGSRSAATS